MVSPLFKSHQVCPAHLPPVTWQLQARAFGFRRRVRNTVGAVDNSQ
jgi:hypothetical protein